MSYNTPGISTDTDAADYTTCTDPSTLKETTHTSNNHIPDPLAERILMDYQCWAISLRRVICLLYSLLKVISLLYLLIESLSN